MSGVLHPVGPERTSTYWLRRALVLGVLAVAVVILVWLVRLLAGPPSAVPAATASSAAPTLRTSAGATAVTTSTGTSGDSTTSSDATTVGSTGQPSLGRCDPSALKPTLAGKQRLRPHEEATFTLSLVNGGPDSCRVSVNAESFELKIVSGRDRIWTSSDCSTSVKAIDQDLASQQAVEWRMTWNGLRSSPNCKSRPEVPKPGTYYATAHFSGAQRVQLRMILG